MSIKANELRIGNWLQFNNVIGKPEFIQVNARFFSSLAGGRATSELKNDEEISGYYQPIPLTESILDKIDWGSYVKFSFNSYFKIDDVGHLYYRSDYTGININTVHHLQNIYFYITGKELDINL